ncbi:MAG: ABC transporter permease [Oscillospiraceae bacterium]|nr:ABC transporter permease [Oscillospiraceae bacterium]
MAIGVYITYRILDVADLTVDGTMATGGAVCVMMVINGYSVWAALLVAFLVGMLAGLVTGIFHTGMGISPILAGILTQLGLWSINLRILGRANQAISVDKYDLLVSLRFIPKTLVTVLIVIAVVVGALYWFFGTERGCSLRATGANKAMARAQGINTNFNTVLGLMLSNGIVALSSALFAQYQGFADVNSGRGAIVIGLAAVIIGEVLFGRLFRNFALKLVAVVLGAIIYYIVIQVVLWLKLDANDLKLLSALVVAVFLAVPYWKNKYTPRSKKGVH